MFKRIISFLLILLAAGCSSDSSAPEQPPQAYEPIAPVNPQPAGNRLFGITVSESSNGFLADFEVAREAGIQVAEIMLNWNDVETSEGVYQDPGGILAATEFYKNNDIGLLLTFAVINTVASTVPDYLATHDWDSPEMISAFTQMSGWVLAQLPADLHIVGVAVGNEVNFVLTGDDWGRYGTFLEEATTQVHTFNPDIKVGVKTTVLNGLFTADGNYIKTLNENTDVVMLNYYLQDNNFQVRAPSLVHNDFAHITSDFPFREIWMTEVGYQSGSENCNSSEDLQAAFYHELFTAWDTRKDFFGLLLVDWLHDASEAQLDEWMAFYGVPGPAFREYLGTLGLRTHDGRDKNAWLQLKAETAPRDWVYAHSSAK